MANYALDRCDKEGLASLSRLAKRLDLKEEKGGLGILTWEGHIPCGKRGNKSFFMMYSPYAPNPLTIHTEIDCNHNDPEIRDTLREIIQSCKCQKVTNSITLEQYDLSEFGTSKTKNSTYGQTRT